MLLLNNPQRGCGRLKKGGFYLMAESSPAGQLCPWAWVLGTHVEDESGMLYVEASNRSMTLFNPRKSLDQDQVVFDVGDSFCKSPHLETIPTIGVLDHVGAQYYTPYKFYREVLRYGPSRRISARFARSIARYLPLPVFFTMRLPVFQTHGDAVSRLIELDLDPSEFEFVPTWHDTNWGIYRGNYYGGKHFMVPLLENEIDTGVNHEVIFGASWFTRSVYVTKGNESLDYLEDLESTGIMPAQIQEGKDE